MDATPDEVGLRERREIDAPAVAPLGDRLIVPAAPVVIAS